MYSLPVTLTVYLFSRTIYMLIVLYSLPVMRTNSLPVTHSNSLPVMLTVYLLYVKFTCYTYSLTLKHIDYLLAKQTV